LAPYAFAASHAGLPACLQDDFAARRIIFSLFSAVAAGAMSVAAESFLLLLAMPIITARMPADSHVAATKHLAYRYA